MAHTATKAPVLREHMSEYHLRNIAVRTCLHIDVSLVQNSDDELYFMIETRIGGFDLIKRTWLAVNEYSVRIVPEPDLHGLMYRYVNDKWGARRSWLDRAHRRDILPILSEPAGGFKVRSVRLHYVTLAHVWREPCEGLSNYFAAVGRGRHRAAPVEPVSAPVVAPVEPNPARLGRRDRSIMRTLDKLLRLA